MFNTHDGNTYAFKGNDYYKLTENAVAEGYPKKISDGWPGLSGKAQLVAVHKYFKTETTHNSNRFCNLFTVFQATLTLHLHTKMVKHTFSKALNTGVTQVVKWTATILKKLAMVSLAFQTIWTQPLCGAVMAKSISTKEVNFGDSIH